MSKPTADKVDLHAIGDVAEATGITPETLRVWERRYGRPEAVRLPSGHRRYTDDQITWLRRVAEALALGHRPNKVIGLDDEALDALLADQRAVPAPDEGVAKLLDWTRDLRGVEIRAALEAWWSPQHAVAFLTERVTPFLRAIGGAWADGRLDVRHEHFASEIVQDTLRRLRDGFPRAGDRKGVLLATLPGETHGLGLQMAALVCAVEGIPYHLLGVDSPVEEIAAAAAALEARAVGISVSLSTRGVETDRVLAALRDALPSSTRLIVGGQGARGARRGPRGVEFTAELSDWAAALRTL